MTKHEHEHEATDVPKEKPKPSMLDLAKKLDAAVREAETKHQAVEVATATLAAATQEQTAAMEAVTGLHAQIQALLQDILSVGGTVHVAQS